MIMKPVEPTVLKQIVHEVLDTVASKMLLGRVYAILDEVNKDPAAQKQACSKIEKMVSLFIGPDKAQILEKRFRETLN